jgi:hypothetical protein
LRNRSQLVTVIPAHKEKVYIELSADSDLDLYLEAADGTVLLRYDYWNSVHWNFIYALRWRYHDMTFTSCVDGCTYSMEIGPYYDNSSYTLMGNPSYSDECKD